MDSLDLLKMVVHTFQVVNEPADIQCPIVEMSTRSKLSCLSWNKHEKNHIASSDYEGIVTVWDVTTRQVITLPYLFPVAPLRYCAMYLNFYLNNW